MWPDLPFKAIRSLFPQSSASQFPKQQNPNSLRLPLLVSVSVSALFLTTVPPANTHGKDQGRSLMFLEYLPFPCLHGSCHLESPGPPSLPVESCSSFMSQFLRLSSGSVPCSSYLPLLSTTSRLLYQVITTRVLITFSFACYFDMWELIFFQLLYTL